MSILPYSARPAHSGALPPVSGVNGALVECTIIQELAVFYSEAALRFESETGIRSAAVEFHRVNRQLMRESDIVPFRFPTLLKDVSELREFVLRNREVFQASLESTHNHVQMEIWLSSRASEEDRIHSTGTAYLREKATRRKQMEMHKRRIEDHFSNCVQGWKFADQGDALRCYALVARAQIAEFRRKARQQASENPSGRVTGPWPPTQFMPLDRFAAEPAS